MCAMMVVIGVRGGYLSRRSVTGALTTPRGPACDPRHASSADFFSSLKSSFAVADRAFAFPGLQRQKEIFKPEIEINEISEDTFRGFFRELQQTRGSAASY
jgi:hypothetical protein